MCMLVTRKIATLPAFPVWSFLLPSSHLSPFVSACFTWWRILYAVLNCLEDLSEVWINQEHNVGKNIQQVTKLMESNLFCIRESVLPHTQPLSKVIWSLEQREQTGKITIGLRKKFPGTDRLYAGFYLDYSGFKWSKYVHLGFSITNAMIADQGWTENHYHVVMQC